MRPHLLIIRHLIRPKGAIVFDNIFTSGKTALINNILSSKAALKLVNSKLSRYGELLSLRYEKECFHAEFRLLGSSETVNVAMKELMFTEDCKAVELGGFSSSAPWCQNLLEDFVEGREFEITGEARTFVKPLAKLF